VFTVQHGDFTKAAYLWSKDTASDPQYLHIYEVQSKSLKSKLSLEPIVYLYAIHNACVSYCIFCTASSLLPSVLHISKMGGRYWPQLTNRKETPPCSTAGPYIRSGFLWSPHLFKNLALELENI
jgi:hypothetical protein